MVGCAPKPPSLNPEINSNYAYKVYIYYKYMNVHVSECHFSQSLRQTRGKDALINVTLTIALRVHAALALLQSVISVSPCQTY